MNCSIKHNSVDISDYTLSYVREARICTGIGTLDIVLSGTYSAAIIPHDSIDIYENGDFKVRYYVSQTSHNIPDGTITLECQDKSKYLVDYFIPDSYTVDYPSYTRYWIEKFLTEAGITYQFASSSQGNLLSNYTQLGLQPAYDQIMMLLQLSGWYMYFDGNGKAIIGSLDVDLAQSAGSLGTTDILDIKRITDDKMLRNRALVWGQYDPISGNYAFADVRKRTRWDYDSRDIRTMVVSNSNIPNSRSAYSIANILVKEFARATIEKHIVAWGARDFNLGNSIRINSHVWRGKGLITTFGVEMSRTGLTTNIILDERCPRLYGFFNFGDWVYVGTFGNGVWRKHIKFDSTWYNFSTGLTDLSVTDLHINNGIFGAVGASGNMFRAYSEDGPWYPITTPTGLMSSSENDVSSGTLVLQSFSGIKARATIVDKETNNVKFGVDNWSGLNTGDYFLSYSGMVTSSGVIASGVTISGHNRGWILEYDPFAGSLVGDLGSGIYPISVSGNYDITVIDLENDGLNDYVSVKTGGGNLIPSEGGLYNFGQHTSTPPTQIEDLNSLIGTDYFTTFSESGESIYSSLTASMSVNRSSISVFNNEIAGERDVVWIDQVSTTTRFHRLRYTKVGGVLSSAQVNSPVQTSVPVERIAVVKLSTDLYRFYFRNTVSPGGAGTVGFTITYRDWDVDTNTVSPDDASDSTAHSFYYIIDPSKTYGTNTIADFHFNVHNNTLYQYIISYNWSRTATASYTNYIIIYKTDVNLMTGAGTTVTALTVNFEDSEGNGVGLKDWRLASLTNTFPNACSGIFHDTAGAALVSWVYMKCAAHDTVGYEQINYLISTHDGSDFQVTEVDRTDSSTDPDFLYNAGGLTTAENIRGQSQLTGTRYISYAREHSTGHTYVFDGSAVALGEYVTEIPWQWKPANIWTITGAYDISYVAKNGSDWYFCNPETATPETLLTYDAKYTITKPFSNTALNLPFYFWHAFNSDTSKYEILRSTNEAIIGAAITPFTSPAFDQRDGFICGNIFVDYVRAGGTKIHALYVDNQNFTNDATRFLVLQRRESNFHIIQESAKPIRIDISNSSPVLTVLDLESTFISNFVSPTDNTQVIPISGLTTREVRDYRYTLLETETTGEVVGSGAGILTQALYVNGSGVYHSDTTAYSGGFILMDIIASGIAERIETTNYTYPGQYLFVTTSGDNPMFYQKDNDGLIFNSYSGLPSGARATIIRCDDRI